MVMANFIVLWAWAAVGLKARLKAAATKPLYRGWYRVNTFATAINHAWGWLRPTRLSISGTMTVRKARWPVEVRHRH